MHRQLRYAVLATALLAGTAFAGARQELDAFTRGLKGLDGQFSQKVTDANGRAKETSSGRVALSAPRLFRWEYAKPYKQLIVADGKKVWVFDPDLEQVTVRVQGTEEQNSPLTALIDPARLDKQYDVSEEAAERDGLQWLSLTPKVDTEASFQMASLGFGKQGLARMEIVDAVGQRTAITFEGWKRNPAFAADTFRFTPAKGVDVVGDAQ
ncbi:outer membrane lipoprotein chaperone LolA [Xanthomonas campestris pv. raphani]|uniref:outer membrane lipoprotein chaperone LolA n=1 Tax=Xanthomonas TaxID=338 RepID=UPI00021AF974|nr:MULTISPECIES: outer membrane lipoprotein chaperone LolA [Xanthomonas]AEL07139.1 outer membrane lipoprotein carrier protein LolA [Xanthomonas campestris pv. raphani 756C]MCC8687205.1 outer membrane lipoprotein chaperone LolA [Xanthomonas campestris]MCC8690627.1 outer membrane lipoprotein chaperone LolA [Xanthomonas campestris]MCF8826568.1 outer membrane lipoprotein chaperone LolA [Xanthomonas campestris pv. raphani]MCW1981071.1 outer membrane lipoprotein carrier protein [Xanthomonas campestr